MLTIVAAALIGFVPSDHLTEPHCEGLTGEGPRAHSGRLLPWMTEMQSLLSLLATGPCFPGATVSSLALEEGLFKFHLSKDFNQPSEEHIMFGKLSQFYTNVTSKEIQPPNLMKPVLRLWLLVPVGSKEFLVWELCVHTATGMQQHLWDANKL